MTETNGSRPWCIPVANQKGGVGKTTVTLGLAAAIEDSSGTVVVFDADPQQSATEIARAGSLPFEVRPALSVAELASIRQVRGIHAFKSAEKDGTWLTLREAAQKYDVTSHRIRKLIKAGVLRAEQVVPGAPFQILAADLAAPPVVAAIGRKGCPCHLSADDQLPMFPDT